MELRNSLKFRRKVYGDKVQILSGLNGGEQVVTSGQINLDNGSKINIVK